MHVVSQSSCTSPQCGSLSYGARDKPANTNQPPSSLGTSRKKLTLRNMCTNPCPLTQATCRPLPTPCAATMPEGKGLGSSQTEGGCGWAWRDFWERPACGVLVRLGRLLDLGLCRLRVPELFAAELHAELRNAEIPGIPGDPRGWRWASPSTPSMALGLLLQDAECRPVLLSGKHIYRPIVRPPPSPPFPIKELVRQTQGQRQAKVLQGPPSAGDLRGAAGVAGRSL